MEDCILEGTSACESAVSSAEIQAENDLPVKLDSLYSDIKADAPNAHAVVTGYPEFYDLAERGSSSVTSDAMSIGPGSHAVGSPDQVGEQPADHRHAHRRSDSVVGTH
jgi:hypothetical protein